MHNRKNIISLLIASFLVRWGYWLFFIQPKYSSDTPKYLYCAKLLARGDIRIPFELLPFYQLYPLFLSPIHIFHMPEMIYIKYLHIFFSVSTVLLVYYAGRLLVSHKYGLTVGALAAVYPSFLFWMPYVLTETAFLFFLSLFIVAFLLLLKKKSPLCWVGYLVTSALLLITRPVSVPILLVSAIALSALFLGHAFKAGLVPLFLKIAIGLAIFFTIAMVILLPHMEEFPILLKKYQFSQTIYRSVNISTSDIAELKRELDKEEKLAKAMPEMELRAYKVRESAQFISTHPFLYLSMAGKRFIAYWYPWVFADSWSLFHRMLDFFISVSLTLGAIMALFDRSMRSKLPVITLMAMIISLAVLSAFSRVDTDARFRLPAELMLLLIAPHGLQILSSKFLRKSY